MRLLVVTQYFWPEDFRVNELVSELAARGHELTVLTGHPNYPEGMTYEAFRREPARFGRYEGATVFRVPLRPRGKGRLQLSLNYLSFVFWGSLLGPWLLRGRAFDAVFVFQTSPITVALPALILRRIKRVPLAMWVLDLWPETLPAVGAVHSPVLLGVVGSLVRFIYKRCDVIFAQSKSFFQNIEARSQGMSRISYLPNWVERAFEGDWQDVESAPELLAYRETFNIMFAGNIGEAQDFPSILDAAERLRERSELRWLIVGDGRAAEAVRLEISRRGLDVQVILLGRYAADRMPAVFKSADALLVALRADPVFAMTIPGKVQTYLASGLPIVGMLDGEGARVITEAGAGLVCPAGEGALLAEHVSALMALTSAEREAMGVRGRSYCRQEFSREVVFSRLDNDLKELVSNKAPHKPHAERTKV